MKTKTKVSLLILIITLSHCAADPWTCCKGRDSRLRARLLQGEEVRSNHPVGDAYLKWLLTHNMSPPPESVDWSKHAHRVGPVVGNFGLNDWAYAATGVLEGFQCHLGIHNCYAPVKLSEQYITECANGIPDYCDGTLAHTAINWMADTQIKRNATYPTDKSCSSTCRYTAIDNFMHQVGGAISRRMGIEFGEDDLKKLVYEFGPVAVHLDFLERNIIFDRLDVLENSNPAPNNKLVVEHRAVLLVGYGVHRQHKYWKIRDSNFNGHKVVGYAYLHRERYDVRGYLPFRYITIPYPKTFQPNDYYNNECHDHHPQC